MSWRRAPRAARRGARAIGRRVRTQLDWIASRRGGFDLAVFHDFEPPPAGGGHQFLRALDRELTRRGYSIERGRISAGTKVCLFNSFNFDFDRLRRFAREDCRMVHRVDGPVGAYRGFDDGTDGRITAINAQLADATVLQSQYSLDKHRELGYELRDPVVVHNAVDPEIFRPPARHDSVEGRPLRVIATSWSANPRKGGDILNWLDRHLDPARFEVSFAGQSEHRFERIRWIAPLDSHGVAELLRSHDVYLAASRDDPCSNALLEALACGLPAAYLESGGHPELVGGAGLPFRTPEELPDVLAQLAADLEAYRAQISVTSISAVADAYLRVLGIAADARP